jgi:wyosine [tRNA(Phe)-imidazoG37] synthetase (radical SAM superfamily)
MSTFLFDRIIFGPVSSRRLGVSLGINLLPRKKKVCNFNCIYCECGWSPSADMEGGQLPRREEVSFELESRLMEMKVRKQAPDVITFAGNGEPTLHPQFCEIIDDTISLRNNIFPRAKIAVLSNASTIANLAVKDALRKIDMNILKLDSVYDETICNHNQPRSDVKADELIRNLIRFEGRLIIQTLFLRGIYRGKTIDNTTEREITGWLDALARIRPSEVMIYTIARDTPEGGLLRKVSADELNGIARRVEMLGIKTQVSP